MIIDSSAVVAILRDEPEARTFLGLMRAAERLQMSTATALEVYLVQRAGRVGRVEALLDASGIELAPFDAEQLATARDAARRFGRRSDSPANLTFGDCMVYALAKVTDQPLLFKGDNFTHTDITPAI